jgi:DNA-binding LytR/AlgR family response regulator
MVVRAIIIEDEGLASKRLQKLIEEISSEILVEACLLSVAQAKKWILENRPPDLVFLDIQLNDGYGFDVLDEWEEHPPVIFTTAYNEYAIRGFKYNGIDYLLKPVVKNELAEALAKFNKGLKQNHQEESSELSQVRAWLGKAYKKRFMVKIGNQYHSYDVEEVAYFFSEGGLTHLVTYQGKSFPVEYTLDQLEELLEPAHFFRINRKFVVSLNAVKEIHAYFNSRLLLKLLPVSEEQAIVARDRASNFKKWLDF